MTFDYERAWQKLALPTVEALPSEAATLYARTAALCEDSRQDQRLLIPWPPGLRERFDAISTPLLAASSRAIYSFGHWSPRGDYKLGAGAYWKYANLADQILRERLGLPVAESGTTTDAVNGASYRVCQGYLRACFASPHCWTWRELGPATPELLQRAQSIEAPRAPAAPERNRNAWLDFEDAGDAWLERVEAAAHATLDATAKAWLAVTETYTK